MSNINKIKQLGIRQQSVVPKFGRASALVFIFITGTAVIVSSASQAQTLEWDTTTGDNTVNGGTGTWDGATQNWTADVGNSNIAWGSGGDAVFGGTAGTVDVSGPQAASGLSFTSDGYTLTGNIGDGDILTLTGTNAQIDVATGTATLGVKLADVNQGGLVKTGDGTLILSEFSDLYGMVTIDAGTLSITKSGVLNGTGNGVTVNSGATFDVAASEGIDNFIGSGSTVIANGQTLSVGLNSVSFSGEYSGVISGAGALHSYADRTLSGDNTFTGGLTVQGGALLLSGSLDTNAINIVDGISGYGDLVVAGNGDALSDTVVINNSATLTLSGNDETIGSVFGAGDINLNENRLTTGDASDAEISGVISGTGGLVKQGTGTLTLSGANTYSGDTDINNGTVTTNNVSALGTGTVSVNGGTLNLASDLTIGALVGSGDITNNGNLLTTGDNNASTTYSGVLSGTGGLTKSGTGTMTLNGANTYTGETIVNSGGTLVAGNANAFGTGNNFRVSGTADLGGFTITKFSTISQGGTLQNGTLNMTGALQIQNATVNTVLSGTGYVASVGGGTSTLSAANTFTGNLVADRGVLDITGSTVTNTVNITDLGSNGAGIVVHGASLADTADVTISNSGVLTVAGDETIGSLASASATSSVVLNADLTTGDAGDDVFAGVLSGAGDLIYQGSGTFELSGASTMTGDIQNTGGGALTLSGSTAGGVVNSAGTFNNSGAIGGTVTNEAGAVFNANSGGTYGADIDNTGDFNIAALDFTLNGTFTNDGTVTNTSGSAVTFTVGTGANFVNNGALDGGASGITLTGDKYTIGIGSTLNAVTLDVENLTANADYDLSGTTDYNFTNNATATVVADAIFSGGDLDNTDILNVAGGDLTGVGELDNSGTVNIGDGTARTLEAASVTNSGTINVNDGSTLRGTGNTSNNSGTVNVAGGGALVETTGDYNNLAGGEINFNDADAKTFAVQTGVITNVGYLNFNGGVTTVNSAGGAIDNSGTITVANGATMDATGDAITNIGTIDMATGSVLTVDTLTNDTGGVVNSSGTLNADVINQGSGDFNILDGLISLGLNFTNTDTATLDVNTGTSIIQNLTNTTTSGTGVTVAVNAGLNANSIQNGLSNGSAASVITNNGGLYSDTSITNYAGATLNSATTDSVIALEGTLTNNGTVNIQGLLAGASVVNSGADAIFNVVGDLNADNSNPLSAFTNQDSAVLNVTGGTFSLDTLTNTSTGTGTTLTTAGVQIAADGGLLVDGAFANSGTGTVNNAGTIEATTITNGADATLVSTGTIDVSNSSDPAAFSNAGIAEVVGSILGNTTNTGDFTVAGILDATGDFLNNGSGTVRVEDIALNVSGDFTNTSDVSGTTVATAGVQVADGASLSATTIVNGEDASMAVAGVLTALSNANDAIDNAGTLTVDASGTVNGPLTNSGTLTSTGSLNDGLTNDGIATISNDVNGVIQNNDGAQLIVDANLAMDNTLNNAAGGLVDVNAGSISGVVALSNRSAGTGTGADAAGFEIDAGASVSALNVLNADAGTLYVAGTLTSNDGISNTGTAQLDSIGVLSGDVLNNATLNLEGILDGALDNDAGTTTITGLLTGTAGAATGTVTNRNGAEFTMQAGTTITLDILENDATSLMTLNGATIDGDVTNQGDIVGGGLVTGLLENNGTVDMTNALAGDELRMETGLVSSGSYALDLDLASGTPGSDLLTVMGSTTGNLSLQFAPLTGAVRLMDSPLMVVDVDDTAVNDFMFSVNGLPTGIGPIAVYASQLVPNGDIAIETGVSLTLGALLEGVAQIEALSSRGPGLVAPHVADICGGASGWGRVTGGEATANSTAQSGGRTGNLKLVSDHSGIEVGANLGCASELGGWDLSYAVLGGMNSGSSTQSLIGDVASVTAMNFEQLYGGLAGSATRGALTADAQLRFAQTDYTLGTSTGGVGAALNLSNDSITTQTIGFAGSLNYRIPVGQTDFAVVPHGGVSIASTSVDALSFDMGETLAADDYTTTSGFVGATVQYESVAADGQSTLNAFVGASYHNSLSEAQIATLTDTADNQARLSTSGVDGFADISFGVEYTSQIDAKREFSLAFKADSSLGDDVEGYAVALQVGLQF